MHSVPLQQAHHASLAPGIERILTICTEEHLETGSTLASPNTQVLPGICNSIEACSGDDYNR